MNSMDPERFDSITDIDNDIANAQSSLSLYPRSDHTHIVGLHVLTISRFARYELLQEKEDLDKSIVHCTEAIFLLSFYRAGLYFNAIQLLFHLAFSLLRRFNESKRPEDVKSSLEYLWYLRGLPLESFDIPRNIVTKSLIEALTAGVKLDDGDVTWNINEMVTLCCELLAASNISANFPIAAFISLYSAVYTEFNRGRSIQSLDKVVECLRDAVRACPQGSHWHIGSFALAGSLFFRFEQAHSIDDYEEATALLGEILNTNQPVRCPDSMRNRAAELAILLSVSRLNIFDNPEYSEMTISRLRAELSSPFIDEPLRLRATEALAAQARNRFRHYGLAESLEEANSYISRVVDLSSSEGLGKSGIVLTEPENVGGAYTTTAILQKIQHLEGLLSNTPPGTLRHKFRLGELAEWHETKFSHTNDISDIEESIEYRRRALDATHSSDPWRVISLGFLRHILHFAFEKTGKIEYLNESIVLGYDILKLESAQRSRFNAIKCLVSSLITRSRFLRRAEDLHEAVRLMSIAIDDQYYAQEPDRFRLSCGWAVLARLIRHPSVLTAYKSAMSLMGKFLSFAPTVSIQHTRLVAIDEYCRTMPLDYASCQFNLGRFEEAVETLEQGRALLWSEMRGLRTPMAQFFKEHSPLAKRFAEINQELEAMTVSITPSGRMEMEDGVPQDRDWTDPFDPRLPESAGFLKAPSFTSLRSAASRGPVVLINHCEWRSDILIIFHKSLPCTIPIANDFYDRANQLRDELAKARKHGLDSGKYQETLCSVLKGLYELVGVPVIKRLRLLGVPEQSRIWWCPTSVFCSLPLHAMGPIPSNDTSERYFSDLYIPSYTPSLSALIESRKASPQMLEKPSLLLVAQPDDSLPGVKGEIKVIRKLEERVTAIELVSREATPASVIKGLRGSRLAHFACHGVLETGKPFEASFKLHGGSRLTLLDIVRSRLPDAEFAFLSCCHAAEITEESIADEALHLTAAMQYCGFRSVVGTMWEMADTDGRDLAKSFYKSLLSSEEASVPYYERSARALRDATQKLRGKRGISLERWVNFVHYGA
ncbi:CHAT domain-containing protein [Lactarius akahatsu]|uniref:CHAT domain-containing protein n=1 Tax=Lactarius akahatsu TaxID=416441 RepID=A0AAD4Q8X7_9AGAM|nr:CHAT domain-containing protein [Lactarius akahatsu]